MKGSQEATLIETFFYRANITLQRGECCLRDIAQDIIGGLDCGERTKRQGAADIHHNIRFGTVTLMLSRAVHREPSVFEMLKDQLPYLRSVRHITPTFLAVSQNLA